MQAVCTRWILEKYLNLKPAVFHAAQEIWPKQPNVYSNIGNKAQPSSYNPWMCLPNYKCCQVSDKANHFYKHTWLECSGIGEVNFTVDRKKKVQNIYKWKKENCCKNEQCHTKHNKIQEKHNHFLCRKHWFLILALLTTKLPTLASRAKKESR